jgi:acyl phosphate:glycerol-3-phosphate acyltransferase
MVLRPWQGSSTAPKWLRMLVVALLAPLAWLLGTFPTAVLVARAKGRDVLREGSGNPGASNVARVLGWRWGAVVLVTDFAKGALATGVGLWVGGRPGAYVLGFAAVLGHTFPLYRKGGKGVATAGGTLAVLYPLIALGLFLVWLIVARALHKASLASLLVTVAFPVAVALTSYEVWEDVVVAALAVVIVARHAPNIRRLLRRQEIDIDARRT